MMFLSKDTYTKSKHKETSDKLKLRNILKDKLSVIFKRHGHDSQRKTEGLFQIKGD